MTNPWIQTLLLLSSLHTTTSQCGPGCPSDGSIQATSDCSGYYYCLYGSPTQTIYCPSGTLFDPTLQICSHEDSVVCCGDAPAPTPTDPGPSPSTTCGSGCPTGFTGILPSQNCQGYYYCVYNQPTEVITCGTGKLFDPQLLICNHEDAVTCDCTDSASPPAPSGSAPPPAPAPTTCGTGCPEGYTGIRPTTNCLGYYYCTYNQPSSVISCPDGTLFDETNLICAASTSVSCECTDGSGPAPTETAPAPTPYSCGSGCPDGYTGILPSTGCAGFYYCVYNSPTEVMECGEGELFDPNLLICNLEELVTCDCGTVPLTSLEAPAPSPSNMVEPMPTPLQESTASQPTSQTIPITSLSNAASPDICSPCPPTTWKLVGTSTCSGFYTCNEGTITGYTPCPSGHVWNERSSACVIGSECDCNTAYGVDFVINDGDVVASDGNDPWYPDYSSAVAGCVNDGMQPGWMGDGYLSDTKAACCLKNFWWDETCDDSTTADTPSVATVPVTSPSSGTTSDSRESLWYPEWSMGSKCKQGNPPSWMGDEYLFDTEAVCCENNFWWTNDCITASTSTTTSSIVSVEGSNPYYPDWKFATQTCLNDGGHTILSEEYHYTTLAECCEARFWWNDSCETGGSAPAPGPNPYYPNWSHGSETCLNDGKHGSVSTTFHYDTLQECCNAQFWWSDSCESGGTGSDPAPAPGPNPYYPDWSEETCLNDGQHGSVATIYHFDTLQDCCDGQFWWNDSCSSGGSGTAPAPGPNPYYPDWTSETCLNDGEHGSVATVYHFDTLTDCCDKQFWWNDSCSSGGSGSGPAPAPGPNPYYPDWDAETCINDGNHGDLAAQYHFSDKQSCCELQFWWNDSC